MKQPMERDTFTRLRTSPKTGAENYSWQFKSSEIGEPLVYTRYASRVTLQWRVVISSSC